MDEDKIFHTLAGSLIYLVLIFLLRISGKRTLSKWNSFDFIVTIALGSSLATILLSKDTSLIQGMIALALLIFLQCVITFISVRSKLFEKLIKAKPTLLYHRGQFLEDKLKKQRVTKKEILAAVRNSGFASLDQVEAVVLETDGSFSVLNILDGKQSPGALEDVEK
jgi:uncharacterized membrane protein YcaP (DUF421 family)